MRGPIVKPSVAICTFCQRLRDDRRTEAGEGIWHESPIYMAMHNFKAEDIELVHTYCHYCLTFYRQFLASRNLAVQ